jgi:RNA polymerase sigma-70 factor, ECF subfamily
VISDVIAYATLERSWDISEHEAFEATALRETRRLFLLALSILRDEGEAEDAVQETLVKAWRSRGMLGDPQLLGAWLTRVCVNHCISRRRHLMVWGWTRREPLDDVADGERTMTAELMDLDRAYRRLSVRQRAAITLNYRHGYSIDECAALMGCRPGTVRAHVARGLSKLRKELGDG